MADTFVQNIHLFKQCRRTHEGILGQYQDEMSVLFKCHTSAQSSHTPKETHDKCIMECMRLGICSGVNGRFEDIFRRMRDLEKRKKIDQPTLNAKTQENMIRSVGDCMNGYLPGRSVRVLQTLAVIMTILFAIGPALGYRTVR